MPTIANRGALAAQGYGFGASSASSAVYVEDVFSTYLYTGTGASQTITNDIDLSTKGGMVWLKGRSGATDHALYDTVRGATYDLTSTSAAGQTTQSTGLTAFGSTGFTIGSLAKLNTSAATYTSWTFRKQSKFFDIVTYTGTGSQLSISHNLGSVPGMIIVKSSNDSGVWYVYHRMLNGGSNPELYSLNFGTTSAVFPSSTTYWGAAPTSTQFSIGTVSQINTNNSKYVAYLFAHDAGGFGAAGTDSIVSCGSYLGNGSASGPTVTLGWEPQFVLIKNTTASSTNNWNIFDNMRGIPTGSADPYLFSNTTDAEATTNGDLIDLTPTGFTIKSTNAEVNTSNGTYIYLAIRRGPMKTPTDATKVFTTTTAATAAAEVVSTTGFPVDLAIYNTVTQSGGRIFTDRLRSVSSSSKAILFSIGTYAESTGDYGIGLQSNTSVTDKFTYTSGYTNYIWNFRRAPGFFDVVCYTGTGATRTINHNLGVVPELWVIKNRTTASTQWRIGGNVFPSPTGTYGLLNNSSIFVNIANVWTTPTATTFGIGTAYPGEADWNYTADKYVAYLFASCPGISKVGLYTGSGTTKQIDCGFTNGARFVLIKRTDLSSGNTGDWYVWDSTRGIVTGNDPYRTLNLAQADIVNTDYIDPYSAGFEISSTAPAAINASGGSFIFLAIA